MSVCYLALQTSIRVYDRVDRRSSSLRSFRGFFYAYMAGVVFPVSDNNKDATSRASFEVCLRCLLDSVVECRRTARLVFFQFVECCRNRWTILQKLA